MSEYFYWRTNVRQASIIWTIHQMTWNVIFWMSGSMKFTWRKHLDFPQPRKERLVCNLCKTLYGLKQVASAWYLGIDEHIDKLGSGKVIQSWTYNEDHSSWRFVTNHIAFWCSYLNAVEINAFQEDLLHIFEMTNLGVFHYYLGWKFWRDREGISSLSPSMPSTWSRNSKWQIARNVPCQWIQDGSLLRMKYQT